MSIEDEARAEAVEALDRLTQIALDNTSEDVHDAVYEDAKRVRAEWRAHESREFVPSSYGGTYPPQLSDVICSDCGWLTGGPNAHPDAEAQHREQMAGQAPRKVEAAPSDTDWERLIEVMREARNPDGAVVLRYENAADAILAAGFSRAQPVQVEVTERAVATLAKHMANVASDWVDNCDDDDHSLEHSNWGAYMDDARRALVAALGGGE